MLDFFKANTKNLDEKLKIRLTFPEFFLAYHKTSNPPDYLSVYSKKDVINDRNFQKKFEEFIEQFFDLVQFNRDKNDGNGETMLVKNIEYSFDILSMGLYIDHDFDMMTKYRVIDILKTLSEEYCGKYVYIVKYDIYNINDEDSMILKNIITSYKIKL